MAPLRIPSYVMLEIVDWFEFWFGKKHFKSTICSVRGQLSLLFQSRGCLTCQEDSTNRIDKCKHPSNKKRRWRNRIRLVNLRRRQWTTTKNKIKFNNECYWYIYIYIICLLCFFCSFNVFLLFLFLCYEFLLVFRCVIQILSIAPIRSMFHCVGIDFGCQWCTLAVAQKGGIDIIPNSASHLQDP